MAEFKEVLKHGRNYLVAIVATRALGFISIPVYTRLLSPNDFGVYSVFIGIIGILSSVMALSTDRSVSRYFFDQKNEEDFKEFVGTTIILALVFFLLNSILLIIFAEKFGNLVSLNKNVVYLIIPISFVNIVGLTFEQIYGPLKKSINIAISSLSRVYIGFSFSILLILLFKSDKYYGQILGQIFAGFIMIFYWVKKIKPYFKLSFDTAYIKYIFTYSVPLIPYALSGVIIEQFGKVALGNSQDLSHAGYYSLALTVGSLVSIVIAVAHQAWNPYYMEYMNTKNYDQVDKDFVRIFKITLVVAIIVSSFGKEIGLLLAKKEFTASLYLIPIFTLGYVFYQFAYAYLRNFGYSKKTHFMTITVFLSGFFNVLMNLILIKKYAELGAAISFTLAYVLMTVIAWFFNKYYVKLHETPMKHMIIPLLMIIPFYIILYLSLSINSLLLLIIFKIALTFIFSAILFWKERLDITEYIKSILNKLKHATHK